MSSDLKNPDDFNDDYPTVVYGEDLELDLDLSLGGRIRLALHEMTELKSLIDGSINHCPKAEFVSTYDVETKNINHLKISPENSKLKDIPVEVEKIGERILVKVGPCDLSGVGGHRVREQIIKNVVNQALAAQGMRHTFEEVNVSACVGVRGRAQLATGFFANNREDGGTHMNAYVKTANEPGLTHWEPRKGPQRFFNDTICAMVTSTTTSIFEKGIREDTIHSSKQATIDILKNPKLAEMFDNILKLTKKHVNALLTGIKEIVGVENNL